MESSSLEFFFFLFGFCIDNIFNFRFHVQNFGVAFVFNARFVGKTVPKELVIIYLKTSHLVYELASDYLSK